ncbi:MAG: hypothetical protein H6622_09190 [Halobacteriovoraceae bacterium]|nr:hypothetical protein [Halobacteriovoraceae bacterium]
MRILIILLFLPICVNALDITNLSGQIDEIYQSQFQTIYKYKDSNNFRFLNKEDSFKAEKIIALKDGIFWIGPKGNANFSWDLFQFNPYCLPKIESNDIRSVNSNDHTLGILTKENSLFLINLISKKCHQKKISNVKMFWMSSQKSLILNDKLILYGENLDDQTLNIGVKNLLEVYPVGQDLFVEYTKGDVYHTKNKSWFNKITRIEVFSTHKALLASDDSTYIIGDKVFYNSKQSKYLIENSLIPISSKLISNVGDLILINGKVPGILSTETIEPTIKTISKEVMNFITKHSIDIGYQFNGHYALLSKDGKLMIYSSDQKISFKSDNVKKMIKTLNGLLIEYRDSKKIYYSSLSGINEFEDFSETQGNKLSIVARKKDGTVSVIKE